MIPLNLYLATQCSNVQFHCSGSDDLVDASVGRDNGTSADLGDRGGEGSSISKTVSGSGDSSTISGSGKGSTVGGSSDGGTVSGSGNDGLSDGSGIGGGGDDSGSSDVLGHG